MTIICEGEELHTYICTYVCLHIYSLTHVASECHLMGVTKERFHIDCHGLRNSSSITLAKIITEEFSNCVTNDIMMKITS